jgi:hypothetical protein
MFVAVGLPVEELSRRRYGPLTDKGLEPGGYRELTGEEVESLRRAGEEVAGEVAKEDEGVPVLLAAEGPEEAPPISDAALVAPDERDDPFTPAPPEMEVAAPLDLPRRQSGEPDDPADPSGEPDERPRG